MRTNKVRFCVVYFTSCESFVFFMKKLVIQKQVSKHKSRKHFG